MLIRGKKNSCYKIILLVGIIFLSFADKTRAIDNINFEVPDKKVFLNDDGIIFQTVTDQKTVADFLEKNKIKVESSDIVLPSPSEKIYSNSTIIIQRAKKVTIKEGRKEGSYLTYQNSVERVVWENNIQLDEDDITTPARMLPVKNGMPITITHVLIKEETQNQDIPFKVITNEDETLGWRIKKVTQSGEKGIKEVKYKVVYNDGKEISRKVLETNIVKDPVNEVDTQGTYVKVGKASTGQASWYAFTGTLSAANPWLPMGSYVKVTNQDNGKSVIVKINDRGPFGNGRIIDLDKVAFQKIADLGSGVANVKMEVVLN